MDREQISMRLSLAGLDRIEQIVKDTGANRSAVIRQILAEAFANDTVMARVDRKLRDRT